MTTTGSLHDHTVVVMGGTAGIGFATARAFLEAGASVWITGRDTERLGSAVTALAAGRVQGAALDARDPGRVERFLTRVGRIDHLVLSFGSDEVSTWFREMTMDIWRRHFDDKFLAHIQTLRIALPRLRPDGSVTVLTGAAARTAAAGDSLWAAADGAMDAVIPTLAVELAPLRVNAVSPGVTATAWWERLPAAERQRVFDRTAAALPARRIGQPADVADAVVFLARNTYVTGTVLAVDGGSPLVL
ncbi:SDR family oxidoreductase [Nocardia wallacei]|uniref:Short chain dehydrogenase n=1 Tax=Nocardia wallacei TaxID=480035 RepID=A0A7G1KMW8_9NOCA|nr:SDR family oxidoreductase [Nocardia wallacei]BCK56577.1 short chain dehydrogenase [Nocardia wallacei]